MSPNTPRPGCLSINSESKRGFGWGLNLSIIEKFGKGSEAITGWVQELLHSVKVGPAKSRQRFMGWPYLTCFKVMARIKVEWVPCGGEVIHHRYHGDFEWNNFFMSTVKSPITSTLSLKSPLNIITDNLSKFHLSSVLLHKTAWSPHTHTHTHTDTHAGYSTLVRACVQVRVLCTSLFCSYDYCYLLGGLVQCFFLSFPADAETRYSGLSQLTHFLFLTLWKALRFAAKRDNRKNQTLNKYWICVGSPCQMIC